MKCHKGFFVLADPSELNKLQEQLKEVEMVRRKLQSDLEHTHAADRKKADLIVELREQLESLRSEHEKVYDS